ncbi:hypothetical protein UFOVP178_43 [uncultured Caudovirales phage]|uniref:Uncharacterized protein n=1 Tax=uncultured Caudovirales phage TaxID=2100421 RepID=A0A6J7WFS2_9CAUD|nr:hypothetical protein UFOVP178_43 [uncultured Caudovirales phage]
MSEKKSNILMPSAIGRLDPVVHAIRAENWDEVQNLLDVERNRIYEKTETLEKQLDEQTYAWSAVHSFWERTFNPEFREAVLKEVNQ